MVFVEVQRALLAAGYNPGAIDGVPGAKSRAAVREFQAGKGLKVDGIAGQLTQAALAQYAHPARAGRPADAIPAGLPWMVEAQRLIGTTEVAGKGNNVDILDWARPLDLVYDADEIPWCGLFTCHCLTSTLPDEPVPTQPLAARNWQRFGMAVTPQLGAVLVFWRGSKQGWSGHVGYYWGEDDVHYHVLGGNQSDQVNITRVAKSRLLSARWPISVPRSGITRRLTLSGTVISQNEA